MGSKTLKDGEGWKFPASFGFTGSASGNVNPKPHPSMEQDEFGDATYLDSMSKAEPTLARGGRVPSLAEGLKGSVPKKKAAAGVLKALQLGKAIGQKTAGAAPGGALGALSPPPAATAGLPPGVGPGAPAPVGALPAMRKGGRARRYADGGDTKPVGSIDKNGDWQIPESDISEHGNGVDRLNNGAFVRPPARPTPRPAQPQDGKARGGRARRMAQGGDTQFDSDAGRAEADAASNYKPAEEPYPAEAAKGGGKDKWAHEAFKPSHKGRLHKALGVPLDEKIPVAKMEAAKHSKSPHVRHMAQAARNINK